MSDFLKDAIFPGNAAAFEELKKSLDAGSTVALIGAGASAPLYPTWVPLLSSLLDEALRRGLISRGREFEDISDQIIRDPLEAAGFIEELYKKPVFRSNLVDIFRKNSDKFTPTHEAIAKLGLGGIVTTNYDEGIENAHSFVHQKNLNSIRMTDKAELTRRIQKFSFEDPKKPIVHLHGVTNHPDSMILTADDYNEHYAIQEHRIFVEQLWRADRLFAIGFGFTDPFLIRIAEAILRNMQSDVRHFALIGCKTTEAISTISRKTFVRKYKLSPIFYEIRTLADGKGEDHSDLLEVLNNLIPAPQDTGQEPTANQPQINVTGKPQSTPFREFEKDFEANLLVTPHNKILYVDPRLYTLKLSNDEEVGIEYTQIDSADIWNDRLSYLIYCGSEYGGSTLCRRICLELSKNNKQILMKDANDLPNYKKSC